MPNRPRCLVIHCSDSEWGDRTAIDQWHKARGWSGIGYHRVLLNGYRTASAWKERKMDCDPGTIQRGRPDGQVGAHAVGLNARSLGICVIGTYATQGPVLGVWTSLVDACARLCKRYGIPATNVVGHRETASGKAQGKTCPGSAFDLDELRRDVAAKLTG